MKKIHLFVSVLALLLTVSTVSAQQIEWVAGYSSPTHSGHDIIGAVPDTNGNLYILGTFTTTSRWRDSIPLYPFENDKSDGGTYLTIIAKVSRDGDLVWKKVIFSPAGHGLCKPYEIRLLGDTAFACLIGMSLASADYPLYYLDTLIPASRSINDWPDYPLNAKYRGYDCQALVVFDMDGNVLEQNFLQVSYLDVDGNDITNPPAAPYNEPWLRTDVMQSPSFSIDDDGNIYLTRCVDDLTTVGPAPGTLYSAADGTISAVKIWCNNRVVGIVPVDSNLFASAQILKFSPHFDTLISSKALFQTKVYIEGYYYAPHLNMDRYGDLYVLGSIRNDDSCVVAVDSAQGIYVNKGKSNLYKGYLIKLDTSFNVRYCISLDDSIVSSDIPYSNTMFHDISFDDAAGLMFLCASTSRSMGGDTSSFRSVLTYQGQPLDRLKNDLFFMTFRTNDDSAQMLSYGRVPSLISSEIHYNEFCEHSRIASYGNRVIMHTWIQGGIHLPDSDVVFDRWYEYGYAFVSFDYLGNVIGGDTMTGIMIPGPVVLHDSTLYLMGRESSIRVSIIKYTNPLFMQEYTPLVGIDSVGARTMSLYPNPAAESVHLRLASEPVTAAYIVTLSGVRHRVSINNGTVNLAPFPSGVLFLQLVTPSHIETHKIIKL